MSTGLEENALCVTPPKDIYVRATVTSSEALKLPDEFIGTWGTFQAEGQDIWIRFDIVSPTANKTATSSVSSSVPAAATNGTAHIPAGTSIHVDFRMLTKGGVQWLAHISAATTGYLRFWKSSGPS